MNWEVFEKALINYDKLEVDKILQHFLAKKNGIEFIDEYIVKSLNSIGDKWEKGEVALSQVYMSSRLCEEIAITILAEKNFPIKMKKLLLLFWLKKISQLRMQSQLQ
ncbi:MAG: cobalamin B12-binding domain protein [Clostridiaceae bacterium]|nr:cobalamin B12-binding domain protein [Clostridiaceae bacterium]